MIRALFALIALLGLTLDAPAQTIPYGGSEVFRFALYQKKLTPLDNVRQIDADPASTIIIVLGETQSLNELISGEKLRSFIARGGAVLIASDSTNDDIGFRGISWQQSFGIRISGNHLRSVPINCYRRLPERPFVQRSFDVDDDPLLDRLFIDLPAVATDRPSEMSFSNDVPGLRFKRLAQYPPGTGRIVDQGLLRPSQNNFAIAGRYVLGNRYGAGRMLVLADHSVFVNGMLGFKPAPENPQGYTFDNGNWAFINSAVEWLQDSGGRPRTVCLFIEDGEIQKQFAVESPSSDRRPPMPEIPPEVLAELLVRYADPMLNKLDETGWFEKVLGKVASWNRLLQGFLLLVTFFAAWQLIRWLFASQRAATPKPVSPDEHADMLPRTGLVRQRVSAQVDAGNLYEVARRRVRDRFDRLGGAPGPDGSPPPVMIADDGPNADAIHAAVRYLWPIAYGSSPVAVALEDWDGVNKLLEQLVRKAARGEWSFAAMS